MGYSISDSEIKSAPGPSDFFPIGLYGVDDPSDFPEIAKAGFTLVYSYYFQEDYDEVPRTDADATAYLDAAQQAGLRGLISIRHKDVQDPKNPSKQNLAMIRQRVRTLKAHPALWGYVLFDEPESTGYGRGVPVHPTNFNNAYNAVKQLDTLHPVLTTCGGDFDDTYPYLGIDMMMIQHLILPPGVYDYPWDSLEHLQDAHRSDFATLASKGIPFVFSIQAYNLEGDIDMWPDILKRNPNAVGRHPTREEMRFMAYSGIILGVKSIFFVSQYEEISPKTNPKQWQATTSVNSELKSLSPIFLAPQSQVRVTATQGNAETEFLLKDYKPEGDGAASDSRSHQEKLYLIALNSKEEETTIAFTFSKPITDVKAYNEPRTILTQGNSFTDDFDGYGVHVYEIQR